MGKPYPDFYGGFNNSFTFKKLTLDFLFIFSVGQKIYDDHGKRQLGNMGYGWNQDIRTLDNWQNNNNNTQVPILSLEENRDINSSRHLHDASFIRLRNVNIGYNLPESLCKKIGASKSNIFIAYKIYMFGQNTKGGTLKLIEKVQEQLLKGLHIYLLLNLKQLLLE